MRSTTTSSSASSYGTIRSPPPPSTPSPAYVPAVPQRSSSPAYVPAVPPSTPATVPAWGAPSYTTYPPSATGYTKLPTADSPPTPPVPPVAAGSPVPQLQPQPSPAARISDLVSTFKDQGHALIAARRPWQELFHPPSFSRPASIGDAITRIRRNTAYFRANYILTVLAVLLVSLFYHPFSFFACAALAAAWFFLYFSRTAPLTILGRTFDDGSVLLWLTVATVVSLLFTNVGWNVIGSMTVGVALVGIHAAFRSTDDLFLTEQETAGGGLLNPAMAQFAQVL